VHYGSSLMLQAGDLVPDVSVWVTPGENARPLREVLGFGLSLCLFIPFDWSPT
jgi:hypothetical protein